MPKVKCLFQKHESLSSISRTHRESWSRLHVLVIAVLKRHGLGTLSSMLAQPSLIQQSSTPRERLGLKQGSWHLNIVPKNFLSLPTCGAQGQSSALHPISQSSKLPHGYSDEAVDKKAAEHPHTCSLLSAKVFPSAVCRRYKDRYPMPVSKCQRVQLEYFHLLRQLVITW